MRRSRREPLLTALAAAAVLLGACGAGPGSPPGSGSTASLVPATSASPAESADRSPGSVASPVEGVVVRIDAEGLTRVTGFRLRSAGGIETGFTIGILENGVEFPPGHLAEHMSTSSSVRVFFRDEGGSLVVYRIEDAE